jgi:hypothetical protein
MGAFDDYQPPKGDAFGDYKPPASWTDSILHHLASVGAAADAGVRSFDRAITFGMFDKLLGQATGQDETAITKQEAAAHPYASTAGSVGGYLVGPGKIGIAKQLGGGVLGLGAEGALTSGATAVVDEQDPTKALIEGGATGLGGALVGKALNPVVRAAANTGVGKAVAQKLGYGALKTPEQVTDALANQEKQDWQTTRGFTVPNADVRQAATQAQQDIDSQAIANPRVKILGQGAYKKLDQLGEEALGNQPVTAERLNDYKNDLHVTNTGDQSPQAGLLGQNRVDQLLAGPAQEAIDAAKRTSQQYRDAQALQKMGENLANFRTPPNSPAKAIAQRWYDPGDPQYEAWADVANSGRIPATAYGLAHAVHWPILMGLGGLGMGGHVGEALGGLGTYAVAKPLISGGLTALQRRAQQQAIENAYPALTGMRTAFNPDVRTSEALRALLFAPAAAAQ